MNKGRAASADHLQGSTGLGDSETAGALFPLAGLGSVSGAGHGPSKLSSRASHATPIPVATP